MTEFASQKPNMYTGTASVNIPLYSINFDGWSLPLSLSYNGSGIRPNEEATEVGLGWALNATGVISRSIDGYDDLYPGGSGSSHKGYVYNTDPITFSMGYSMFGAFTAPPANSYFNRILVQGGEDTQPDVFNFNFFGFSGSFILSQKAANPLITSVKITEGPCSILFNETGQTFTIVTPDGFRGEFDVKERSTSVSGSTVSIDRMACCSQSQLDIQQVINDGRFRTITSWYLSKITSPNGLELNFTYDMTAGTSPYLCNRTSFSELEDIGSQEVCQQTIHEYVYLQKIESLDVRLDFTMEDREDLHDNELFTPGTAMVKFPFSQPLKRFSGIQITGLTPGSTFSKTIVFKQSYFNDQYRDILSNNFNSNEYQWLRGRLDRVTIDDQQYRFYYEAGNGLPNKLTNSIDHFGFYNGQSNPRLLPPESVDPAFLSLALVPADTNKVEYYKQRYSRRADLAYGKTGVLKKVAYPTQGYTLFEYELHTYIPNKPNLPNYLKYDFFREQEEFNASFEGNVAGGLRIKSIKEYDYNDQLVRNKSYQYTDYQGFSTGKLTTPLYTRYAVRSPYVDFNSELYWNFKRKTHSSVSGSGSAQGKLLGYSRVQETVSGTSDSYKNVYFYQNTRDSLIGYNVLALNFPSRNGQLKEERNYNSANQIVKRTTYDQYYKALDSIKAIAYQQNGGTWLFYLKRYYIRRSFTSPMVVTTTVPTQPSGITVNAQDVVTSIGNASQTTKKTTYSGITYLQSSERIKNSEGDSIVTRIKRPFDYSGTDMAISHMKDPLMNLISNVVEEIHLKNGTAIAASANKYFYNSSNRINLIKSYSFNKDINPVLPTISDGATFEATGSPYEKIATFTSYDYDEKLLEYVARDGIVNSFIWENRLPVVHGVGITNSQLQVAYAYAKSTGTYETSLRNHANVVGKQVTTYLHNPQVGVTKVTNPAAVSTSYAYDGYSRLEKIIDNDGKTVQQQQYHFKEYPPLRTLVLSGNITFPLLTEDAYDVPMLAGYIQCDNNITSKVLTISNTGEDDLNVTSLSFPQYFSSTWMGGVIPPQTSVDVIVNFSQPPSPGTYGGTITVNSNKTSGTSTLSVSATYQTKVCNLAVSASVLDFGAIMSPYAGLPFTVTNNGNSYIKFSNPAFAWDGLSTTYATDAQFSATPNFAVCLPPGGHADFTANFTPNTLDLVQSAKLSLIMGEGCSSFKDAILMKGEKVTSFTRIISAPSNVPVPSFTGTTSTQAFDVQNTGNTPMQVTNVTSSNTMFAISSTSFAVPAHGYTTLTATFTPPAQNFTAQSTTLTFTSNATNNTSFTMTLSGQRTEVKSVSVSTGSVYLKPSTGAQSIYITNTGNSPVSISTPAETDPSNAFAEAYQYGTGGTYSFGSPLQPGITLVITVSAVGGYSSANGTLSVPTDSPGGTYIINLARSEF
ncbi:hypothetical protein BH09BAC3_BH09BAC3_28500 [soil metagenome]